MSNIEIWQIIVNLNYSLIALRESNSLTPITINDLVELRNKLRVQLERLRLTIIEQYSERDAYFVLFPLIAHCDESVKKIILTNHQLEWPSLQQELYQVSDGGDLFYDLLDSVLEKPDTLPLVYEVYYFCLKDGFCGRHSLNSDGLANYMKKLHSHIRLQPIAETNTPPSSLKKWTNFRMINRVYYGGTLAILILMYFFFIFLANSWQPTT